MIRVHTHMNAKTKRSTHTTSSTTIKNAIVGYKRANYRHTKLWSFNFFFRSSIISISIHFVLLFQCSTSNAYASKWVAHFNKIIKSYNHIGFELKRYGWICFFFQCNKMYDWNLVSEFLMGNVSYTVCFVCVKFYHILTLHVIY